MQSAMQNRTSFVVAHRLSTLRRADHVLVLEHGRVVESARRRIGETSRLYREAAQIQIPDEESMRMLGIGLEVAA
jgi:ATP-binding cassette subfamily B protein